MKQDELAFVNRQLAGLLRSGIPLEGALRQLSETMARGALRDELSQLERDLAEGVPWKDALARRRLPKLYVHLLRAGAQGDDLPAVLNLMADYYQQVHTIAMRVRALVVYPIIILVTALGLSVLLTLLLRAVLLEFTPDTFTTDKVWVYQAIVWSTPGALAMLTLGTLLVLSVPRWRGALGEWLPAFREARLARIASALALLMGRGGSVNDALDLMVELEGNSRAGRELRTWRQRVSDGFGRVAQFAAGGRFFPPLFVWLVASAGDDLAAGFRQAAELYQGRALHRVEMMLYAFLPVAVLVLGLMIIGQVAPFGAVLGQLLEPLTSVME